ncbi:MAG: branched-chain amino acid ABC transporter permease [Chloroflexi bacterium]|nr:branched-chain amino acid ABC transporter permease [Chloroflexota bacterium]
MRLIRRWGPWLLLVICLALPVLVKQPAWLDMLQFTFMYAAMSVGWDIMGGYAGYPSIGHVGFFGMSSYVAGLLLVHFGVNIFASALLVGLFGSLVGAGLGFISLRTRGPAFLIVTLVFALTVQMLAENLNALTGGTSGLYLPLLDLPPDVVILPFYYAMLALTVLAVATSTFIRASRFGLGLLAIREDEGKAEGSGINTALYKILAFAVSVFFASVAGALHAQYLNYVDPDLAFEFIIGLNMVVMALVGSRATPWGGVLGAVIMFPISQLLVYTLPDKFSGQVPLVELGILLILIPMFLPDGIIKSLERWAERRRRRPRVPSTDTFAPAPVGAP